MPDVSTIAQRVIEGLESQPDAGRLSAFAVAQRCAQSGGVHRRTPSDPDDDAIERWDFEDGSAIIIWYAIDLWDEAAHSADACVNDPDLLWVGATDRPARMEPDQARAAYREKAAQLLALARELDELSQIAFPIGNLVMAGSSAGRIEEVYGLTCAQLVQIRFLQGGRQTFDFLSVKTTEYPEAEYPEKS